jgi:Flp pilus assembly protein TadG
MTGLSLRIRQLLTDADAVAATEFAMVVPFMLLLYVGGTELGNGMSINVKVSASAHTVADLAAQYTQLTTAKMQDILHASTATIAPYPVTDGLNHSLITVTVSEVSTDASGRATVQWSQKFDGTTVSAGRTVGQVMTLPPDLAKSANNNMSFILGEVAYAYTPSLGSAISGTVTLRDSYYLYPRCSTNSTTNSTTFPYYDIKYPTTALCTCVQHMQQKSC